MTEKFAKFGIQDQFYEVLLVGKPVLEKPEKHDDNLGACLIEGEIQ